MALRVTRVSLLNCYLEIKCLRNQLFNSISFAIAIRYKVIAHGCGS